jgi:hypothetical protein
LQHSAGDALNPIFVNAYTLADSGAAPLPNTGTWGAGTFRPASYETGIAFPGPAPGTYSNPGPVLGGTATFASTFNGTNPNGAWDLFVIDQAGVGRGTPIANGIHGGWTLDITAIPEPSMMLVLAAAPLVLRRRR